MPDGGNKCAFIQGYNAQAVVDSHAQIFVASDVTQQTNGSPLLAPLLNLAK